MEMPEKEGWWRRPYYSAPVESGKLLRYTMSHDYVAGDFMWTGIDYLGEAHWPERSSSAGILDTCALKRTVTTFIIFLMQSANEKSLKSGEILQYLGQSKTIGLINFDLGSSVLMKSKNGIK